MPRAGSDAVRKTERGGAAPVCPTMLFYQFVVSRTSALAPRPRRLSEAKIMLRVDTDIERATDNAVAFLEDGGWQIASVRRAQLIETANECGKDETLLSLHRDAWEHGLACAITAFRGQRSPTVPESEDVPTTENAPSPENVGL